MAKVAKCGKCIKNVDNTEKMWTIQEKRASAKELSPVDPYKRDLLCVNKECCDQVDEPPIGHFQ